ncbi:GSCFA domain-containing protein [uncultured Algibacter sp.]|uniref:GSCFA domain-containing protein n=1 Tax=uncultured Algibacter sp. TaxID=298659 RepID=UPI00262C167C|nr:GSCFA domain-containing protein [uncultured Algibacter sp.]
MELQTKIPLEKQSKNLIDYNSNILLLGSCFSENIGEKLDYFKFQNTQNPFGILFHPKAIEILISNAVNGKQYSNQDVFNQNEQWHSFDAHSRLSSNSKDDLLNALNTQVQLTSESIQKATHVIITLGTSWVYRFLESDKVVANCHKVPQKQFKKELLNVEDISKSLQNIINLIERVNHKAIILFTVSPVRHLKDGFIENTLAKSNLISAIHTLLNIKVLYFPSYEIMMDELRDYRFYNQDMIHPSPLAINYIWEKFQSIWISDESIKTMQEVETIQKGNQHKPFNQNSEAHQRFLQNLNDKKDQISFRFPHIKF